MLPHWEQKNSCDDTGIMQAIIMIEVQLISAYVYTICIRI